MLYIFNMICRTHIAFAIAPILIIESAIDAMSVVVELLFYLSIAIGSISPDLDEEGSRLSKVFPLFPMIYDVVGIKHRGVTHQLIFVLVLAIGLFIILNLNDADFVSNVIFYGLALGYFMHLPGDMLTKGGINNFYYPLTKSKGILLPRAFRFYTHSKEELLFLYFLYFVICSQVAYRILLWVSYE